jgi:hypothetical protein
VAALTLRYLMQGLAQPEDSPVPPGAAEGVAGTGQSAGGKPNPASTLDETELGAALQLLVERAQYITGATGTALALPQGDEMVCRASAGSCAPAVGARLQVRSGLTGESIARHQLLRCDNAETDPRVNLETCRALGIASIVVLPLLRRNGEVRGLFELFSDHPYAFEERDLIALERMAALTLTALDLAEQRHGAVPSAFSSALSSTSQPSLSPSLPVALPPEQSEAAAGEKKKPANLAPPANPAGMNPAQATGPAPVVPAELTDVTAAAPVEADNQVNKQANNVSAESSLVPESTSVDVTTAQGAPLPEAMSRVQKCSSCGFPVSEGRTLCLDCEKKETGKKQSDKKAETKVGVTQSDSKNPGSVESAELAQGSTAIAHGEILPPFLANAQPVEESWLADHVNLLAILVLIVGILVAVVVFR